MGNPPVPITRREALKRGAIIGGTVLWAVPVVQTLGMGQAFAATPSDQCVATWAKSVIFADQGDPKDDSLTIPPERSDPENALLAPDSKFFSLGYGGELVVRLAIPYYSGKNGEAIVVETTGGSYPEETAVVSVSATGDPGSWIFVGTASNTATPSLEASLDSVLPAPPSSIQYVRLVDTTDRTLHNAQSDGFDVNAVGISCP